LRSSAPTLLGSTTPRLWTRPLVTGPPGPCGCGCALAPESSKGFSVLDFAEDPLRVSLFPWQRWLFIHALELRRDGRFRYRTVLILVARQGGKTTWVEIKNLWKMYVLRVPLIISTAQNLDISEESWDKAVEIAESIPDLSAEIKHVDRTNGKKSLRLANGSRWKIAAASRRGGRGLAGDDIDLDELREHHTWDAWGAVTKTTMARRNAQVFAYSNAGDDKSLVLNELQDRGRAVVANPLLGDSSFGHFEWSAPDEVKCTCIRPDGLHTVGCRLRDRSAMAAANPSVGYDGGVTVEALDSALDVDPEPVFRTECLCQRVPVLAPKWSVVPAAAWRDRAGAEGPPEGAVCFALAAAWPDAEWGSVGVAGLRGGETVVQVADHREGVGWMVQRAVELDDRHPNLGFVLDEAGPAGRLKADLLAAGFKVAKPGDPVFAGRSRRTLVVPSGRDVAQAAGQFYTAVCGDPPTLRHFGQPELDAAVAGAQKRPLGDAWAWARKGPDDTSPLEGVSAAAWGFATRSQSGSFFVAWR
jgi:hypothetical protein